MRPRKGIAPGKAGSRTWGDKAMPLFLCLSPCLDPTLLCIAFSFWLILLYSAAPRLLVLRVRNPDKRAGPFLQGHLLPSIWHRWIIGLSQADLWVPCWVLWSGRLASMSRPVVRKEIGQQAGTFTWVTESGEGRFQKGKNSLPEEGKGTKTIEVYGSGPCLWHIYHYRVPTKLVREIKHRWTLNHEFSFRLNRSCHL